MNSKKNVDNLGDKQIKDGDKVSGLRVTFLLLDTGWRVAVPVIALTMLGHYIDQRTDHTALFLLVGFFISLAVAILLVYRQLCLVFPDQFGKNKINDTTKKENK